MLNRPCKKGMNNTNTVEIIIRLSVFIMKMRTNYTTFAFITVIIRTHIAAKSSSILKENVQYGNCWFLNISLNVNLCELNLSIWMGKYGDGESVVMKFDENILTFLIYLSGVWLNSMKLMKMWYDKRYYHIMFCKGYYIAK